MNKIDRKSRWETFTYIRTRTHYVHIGRGWGVWVFLIVKRAFSIA